MKINRIIFVLINLLWSVIARQDARAKPGLAIAMICRDEAVNFKANLAGWLPIVDYYVFMIDSRTTDESVNVINNILKPAGKDFKIVHYNFTGFGQGRTQSLKETWDSFPQASHVLIADPDWSPDVSTMDIYDLDDTVDVFRFTAFDRNGVTRRRMDWLLRHRAGLAMRYHLHEVLDIGMYDVKNIFWEVREIEKPGSWHTTVGHTDSFAADRYKFDLDLLYKDLAAFGHDPHTHYYLGVTHDAFASKASKQLGVGHPEVQRHAELARINLELRATTQYEDEFPDQRWAVMMQLGTLHASLKRDYAKAVYWFSMCRDYSPSQSECSLALCWLHLDANQLDRALVELNGVLQLQPRAREMVEYLHQWDCTVPQHAVNMLATKMGVYGLAQDEAKYFFILWSMTRQEHCAMEELGIAEDVRQKLLSAVGGPQIDYFNSENDFCSHPDVRAYLHRNEYNVHPCVEHKAVVFTSEKCNAFAAQAPPPYEEFQAGSLVKHFIGAATIPEIIHHAFQGRRSAFLYTGHTLRFLFAEHFRPEMVYNLVGELVRRSYTDVHVVVVSPRDALLAAMQEHLQACQALMDFQSVGKLTFTKGTALEFAAHADMLFDYIEYNGGLSKAARPQEELAALTGLLRDDTGVLGLTYFTHNHHTTRLRALVDGRNATFMAPFSLEATRLVHAYLEQHKLGLFKKDRELVAHLGGEEEVWDSVRYKPEHFVPRVLWRTYTQPQATAAAETAGLAVSSWVPTAYSRPFDEIEHYEIQRFRDAGLSQDQFVEELMVNFRYTIYARKASSGGHAPGRLKLEPHLADSAVIHVIDRAGYLSRSFAGMEQLALHRQSTTIEFAHYGLPGETRFSFIVSPVIAPCLHLLSSYPTLLQLHDANRRFALKERRDFNEADARRRLVKILSYFEMLNLVTYEGSHTLANVAKATSFPAEASESNNVVTPPAAVKTQTVKTIGGLKISSRGATLNHANQSKKTEADARSSERRLQDLGITQDLLNHLRASDREALVGGRALKDDIIIEMLKVQTAENDLIAKVASN